MSVIVFNDKYVSINIHDSRDLNSQEDVKKAYVSSDFYLWWTVFYYHRKARWDRLNHSLLAQQENAWVEEKELNYQTINKGT